MRCFFYFFLLFTHFPSYTFSILCDHHDYSALLQFKNSLVTTEEYSSPYNRTAVRTKIAEQYFSNCYFSPTYSFFTIKTKSWKSDTNCCEWDGVTCDNISGHVINLDLSCGNLEGELHPNNTIFELKHLQTLNLASNNFSGSLIGTRIGDLVNLKHLDLSNNAFSGDVLSTISQLSKLVSLDLSLNSIRVDPIAWKNLILNATNLRELYLYYVNLSSITESSLSLLLNMSSSLVSLGLRNTGLEGNFPTGVLSFPNLEELYLNDNEELSGQLPKYNWSNPLKYLDLSSTSFSGEIPNSIGHLKSLNRLDLSSCKFHGLIPSSFSNLTQLTFLSLSYNKLTGSIGEFSNYSLKYLNLSYNNLEGEFPNSIFQLENLNTLSLSSTNLSGPIDFHHFSKLKVLAYLDLSNNSFLTVNFDNIVDLTLPNIEHIDLSFNKLQGNLLIPSNETKYFLVSNNNFTGSISSTLCNASSLVVLNLAHNNLTCIIPQCLGTLPSLYILDIQMNSLYGSMPRSFSKGSIFETIKLNGNRLEGPLPHALSHCTKLEVLDLGDNEFEDTFPNWTETLQELQVLSLRSNKLHGSITCSAIKNSFPKLRIFDVSNNNFSGPLPTSCIKNFKAMMNASDSQTGLQYMSSNYYYYDSVVVVMKGMRIELTKILTTLTTIDLSNNLFEGEIPQVIGYLHSLRGLNLSHNEIKGTIPLSLSNLRNLEWLDLSRNQLIGEIPVALTKLTFLSVLNLSQNHLEGIIPTGQQFNTFENGSYEGNPMLCGLPLSKSCKNDEERLPTHSTIKGDEEESWFGWKPMAIGYACGTIFGALLGFNVFRTGKPQWLARLIENMFNTTLRRRNRSRPNSNRRRRN